MSKQSTVRTEKEKKKAEKGRKLRKAAHSSIHVSHGDTKKRYCSLSFSKITQLYGTRRGIKKEDPPIHKIEFTQVCSQLASQELRLVWQSSIL